MDYSVEWLPEALDDVDEIAAFIASDSAAYASALVRRILAVAQDLNQFPHRGRAVPEWDDDSVREIFIGNYRLIYLAQTRRVVILAVIHGARLLPESLRDRVP